MVKRLLQINLEMWSLLWLVIRSLWLVNNAGLAMQGISCYQLALLVCFVSVRFHHWKFERLLRLQSARVDRLPVCNWSFAFWLTWEDIAAAERWPSTNTGGTNCFCNCFWSAFIWDGTFLIRQHVWLSLTVRSLQRAIFCGRWWRYIVEQLGWSDGWAGPLAPSAVLDEYLGLASRVGQGNRLRLFPFVSHSILGGSRPRVATLRSWYIFLRFAMRVVDAGEIFLILCLVVTITSSLEVVV